jgi:DNA-binding Lrp family transcriptional regulator
MSCSRIEERLLNDFQRDFPLDARPYARIAEELGVTEEEVIETLDRLLQARTISRIGAIIPPNVIGSSLLVAMKVPEAQLDSVAAEVSRLPEVNHNYAREHEFNLWFVMTGDHADALDRRLDQIEIQFGYPLLRLPLLEAYFIDLGFPIDFGVHREAMS